MPFINTAQSFFPEITRHNHVGETAMNLQLGVVSLISLLSFWHGVLGGQIPKVNRVLGGVSADRTVSKPNVSEPTKRTPGKLRGVVENSRVCGWLCLFFVRFHLCNAFFRDDSRSLSSFRVW